MDVISLAVSLSAQTDERVQFAVYEMLEGYLYIGLGDGDRLAGI